VTTLHLGVINIPYVDAPTGAKGKRGGKTAANEKTTGDIAEILEDKYSIMETFWTKHQGEIIHELESSIAGAFESLMMGAPTQADPNAAGTSKIETMFKTFLSGREMDGAPGVPTAAAMRGVNHRFKHPYARRAPRPSFIDTSTFENSFKAWVD
jgi:hypothetical protein